MNIWDYVLAEDIEELTIEEYESFRNYLRFLGHRVEDVYGLKYNPYNRNYVLLDHDGDLLWRDIEDVSFLGGNRIPLEEVKRMAALVALV